MRNLILLFLLISCQQKPKPEQNRLNEKIDSLLIKNQRNLDSASVQLTKSDSAVSQKIDKTVQKISNLETQVKELKEENNELKAQLDDVTDNGKPYSGLPVSND
jgi:septal ring factor EnvC (AmiA/AmiB activator)